MFRRVIPWVLSLALTGPLLGCGLGVRTRAVFGGKVDLTTKISATANQNTPVAVDLLLVYDKDLLKDLLKTPAKAWFERREQMKHDYPPGTAFDIWQWEWVPGQRVPPQSLPLKARAQAVIIYANYLAPGEHRARVDPHADLVLQLLEKNFTVEPVK